MKNPKKYFGTDGIRGCVGNPPITVDFLLKIGWAVGRVLANKKNPKVVIGKDTRISGYMIESALQSGLSAAGTNILQLGPMPTSAIAYLTRTLRADLGIVISASHNPYQDNGVKFFNAEGYKIPDSLAKAIETELEMPITTVHSRALGKAFRVKDAVGRYIEYCKSTVPHKTNFMNLKIVIDCANGATYHVAPNIFKELGAEVIPIHVTPNGKNINVHCGSTHPEVLQRAVLGKKADLGIAFDGDGDRIIMVDEKGEIVDGDELLYIITKGLITCNRFTGGVAMTYMSNLGLELALNELQVPSCRVPVGDQNITNALLERNWLLGGEPSGHIVFLPVSTTGDGIIAGLQVLQTIISSGKTLNELKHCIIKFPNKTVNIPYQTGHKIDLNQADIQDQINRVKSTLGKRGRVLLRYSGTEPLIRVMVEGEHPEVVNHLIEELCEVIKNKIA